jgi:diadenosine tetraphosphate (Ap4A) HIT family hydrolase
MKKDLPKPEDGALFYEDKRLYAALANYPMAKGHVVVVWKKKVPDLHLLKRKDYEYLMDKVDLVRNVMLRILNIKKVYLMYMDEANHVHWHLVPRYGRKGINALKDRPRKIKDFSLAGKFRKALQKNSSLK